MPCCSVCIEEYNKSKRKEILCNHCNFSACKMCVERVLLESNNDPCCMQCLNTWSVDFLVNNFTKVFINVTLKKHRENQLFEREKAMLPASQIVVERQIKIKNMQKEIKEKSSHKFRIQLQCEELSERIENTSDKQEYANLFKERKLAKLQLENIKKEIAKIQFTINDYKWGGQHTEQQKQTTERHQFIRRCPADDCRGFLNHVWHCTLCDNWTCSQCHELKDKKNHKCNPDNLATAKLISKDTKPCPKCAVMIHRIEGCPQMFCTCCHTVFDWNTLKIDNGHIHNPHYFEMRRQMHGDVVAVMEAAGMIQQIRRPDLNACREVMPEEWILDDVRKIMSTMEYNFVSIYMSHIIHVHRVVKPKYHVDILADNLDLRVKFLQNLIDEKQFKQLVQRREKASRKKREIEQVLTSTYEVVAEVINHLADAENHDQVNAFIKGLTTVIIHANEGMEKIAHKYEGIVPKYFINVAYLEDERKKNFILNDMMSQLQLQVS